jgi:cytochrome c oxidase subunit 2
MWPDQFPLFPERASELAAEVDALYFFSLAVTAFFSVLIAVLVIVLATRYRRRDPGEVGQWEKEPAWLEISWSIVPLVILLFMFVWGTKVYFEASRPPADAREYFVVGKQWMWKFQHPEGHREINTLHVPVGQPIRLTMGSEDVIHSFFVPAFRVKKDVIPGRYTTFWFEATRTGTFRLFCAEYCGAEHSLMIGKLVVMEPTAYERWLESERPLETMATSGEQLFAKYVCNTCHKPDTAALAPILHDLEGSEVALADGSTVTADLDYLRRSILDPTHEVVAGYNPVMPTYRGQISEEELVQLLQYIRSLSAAAAETGDTDTATTEIPEAGVDER